MRVLHVSACDVLGGAAIGAYRLHVSLRRAGHESVMFVERRAGGDPSAEGDPSVIAFEPPRGAFSVLGRYLRRRRIAADLKRSAGRIPPVFEQFSDDRSQYRATPFGQFPPADVINLHWVAGFVDCPSFFRDHGRGPPVVWTLHDMNPFTGGCHHSFGCDRFTKECGACPQIGSRDAGDVSRAVWLRKRAAFDSVPPEGLRLAAPSRWLASQAERSSLFGGREMSVIPHGIDTGVFAPQPRDHARDVLGIPREAKTVLFVAGSLSRPVKRFDVLLAALEGLGEVPGLRLVTAGHGAPHLREDAPDWQIHLGPLSDDVTLSLVYSAADVLALPSAQDNLPLTMIEAISCGTPVVGSDVGGIPDAVRPGITGRLVPPGDADALRDAIHDLLADDGKRSEMSANCRRIAVEEYSMAVQAERYVELYERALSQASFA